MVTSSRNCCPELLESSSPFSVQEARTGVSRHALDLFDTLSLPGSTGGQLAFVGGPAYALDWNVDGTHLAVGAHRSARPVHQLVETYHGAAHIQIWRVAPGANRMSVSHLIPHNGDCAWDLKWRPGSRPEGSTLAAALGDGHLLLYHPTLLPAEHEYQTSPLSVSPKRVPQMTLRGAHGCHDGVRTVQWSPDGEKLAAGTVHGCIELYRVTENSTAEPQVAAQLIVRVRVHESVISTMRWLDCNKLCSAGFDGTQRVRDVRDCLTELERVSDGPAWNLCLVNPEENLIISGSDSGFLKIARLATMSATLEMSEMKKTRVTIASVRDLACMPYQGLRSTKSTVLFLAGGEGKLAVGTLLYPLWRASGCMVRKTRFRPVLQWVVEPCEDVLMADEMATKKDGSELYHVKNSSLVLRLTDSARRDAHLSRRSKSKKVRREMVPVDSNLCADRYDQRLAITRLALTSSGKMIAAGTHAGFLTVLPVVDDMIFGPRVDVLPKKRSDVPSPLSVKQKPSKKLKKSMQSDIVKRKRGRPRKYPRVEDVHVVTSIVDELVSKAGGERTARKKRTSRVQPAGRGSSRRRRETRTRKATSKAVIAHRADEEIGVSEAIANLAGVDTAGGIRLRLRRRPGVSAANTTNTDTVEAAAAGSVRLRLRRRPGVVAANTTSTDTMEAGAVCIPLRLRRKPRASVLEPIPLRIRIRPERQKRVRKETARKVSFMASLHKPRAGKRNAETAQ